MVVGDLRLLLDALEDVRVRLLLPLGQFVPVCDVSRFGVRKVFEDLADPAERDEPALLSAAELICSAVGGTDEGSDLRKLSSGKSLTSYIAQAELCKSRLNSASYLLTGQFNM